jgi:hypothetical protein
MDSRCRIECILAFGRPRDRVSDYAALAAFQLSNSVASSKRIPRDSAGFRGTSSQASPPAFHQCESAELRSCGFPSIGMQRMHIIYDARVTDISASVQSRGVAGSRDFPIFRRLTQPHVQLSDIIVSEPSDRYTESGVSTFLQE